MHKSFGLGALVCAALMISACQDSPVTAEESSEAVGAEARGTLPSVFTLDNSAEKNSVIALRARYNGALVQTDTFPTGGLGSGGGLGSQGALITSRNGRWLFAVNAGSNEISAFEIKGADLILRDIVNSGGVRPISLTQRHDMLYVVNQGSDQEPGNISGFTIDDGKLTSIPNSTRGLSADTPVGPAQIGFSPNGDFLLVTEKGTNSLVSYVLQTDGTPSAPIVTASHGQTPFGFTFRGDGAVYVSEAFGGADGASAVSSYTLGHGGVPRLIEGSVPTHQTAACWIAISPNGRFAYTTNTGSDSVTGYNVGRRGRLESFGDGGATGSVGDAPIDMAFSAYGDVLYVLNAADDSISTVQVRYDGSLRTVSTLSNLPASVVGLATR